MMKEPHKVMTETAAKLVEAIQQATSQYFRLAILVGAPTSGKTVLLRSLAQQFAYPLLNVNLELSQRLLDLTYAQRSQYVDRLFKDVITAVTGDVVLLDNLEILFDPHLEIEPLRLLQMVSRNRTIVASWSGRFQGGALIYAEPGHPEFVQFKQIEAVVIPVAATASRSGAYSS